MAGPGKIIDVSNPPKALETGRGKDEGAWPRERVDQARWLQWVVLVLLAVAVAVLAVLLQEVRSAAQSS